MNSVEKVFSVHNCRSQCRCKNISRARETSFGFRSKEHICSSHKTVINGTSDLSVIEVNPRYNYSCGSKISKGDKQLFDKTHIVILSYLHTCKHARFCYIGNNNICQRAKKTHFGNKRVINPLIKNTVVTHNRVGNIQGVAFFKIKQKSFYAFRLLATCKIAAVDAVKSFTQAFPMI